MSKLAQMGEEYMETAARLAVGLERARGRLAGLEGAGRQSVEHDIALMEGMLREVREVGDLVRHYYEGAYCRDGRYTL